MRRAGLVSACIAQPVPELGPSPACVRASSSNRQRLALSNDDYQALAARHAGVQQVTLKHGVVLGGQGMITAGYSEPCALCTVVA
jgi:hypothetical protein